jgi:hypothetical protein
MKSPSAPESLFGLDKTIHEIAIVAAVPPTSRSQLRDDITRLILNEHEGQEKLNPEYLRKCSDVAHQWMRRFARVMKARSDLARAANELISAISDFDNAYGEADRCHDVAPQPIDLMLTNLLEWESILPPLALDYAKKDGSHRRGRPSGPEIGSFHVFLMLLWVVVESADGKLVFDKNFPDKGSLIKVLDLLRPHLPVGVIPQPPSVRAIQWARKTTNAGFAAFQRTVRGKEPSPLTLRVIKIIDRDRK